VRKVRKLFFFFALRIKFVGQVSEYTCNQQPDMKREGLRE